ncbi:hypothetical protein [Pollutimonas thiosulfatoxidans]|uniref:Uncharacterized protein n=1 Tax=Pollutimonas thiosulfatoxidans TaxID=2028345 RepID=A0A410GCZ7_9BURK|nr:hypothetical protein [Pollutimonas thiosulfatoxidans]MBF6616438.1 hypothetical protein [Candidimonas sp.]NYT43928.1 hypothetical protein [Alcaligenaceae bacterium]QAA94186.1 hypothetical protein CKA81_10345 [Pollutimonas thiosulfatoxidans]
MLYIIQILAAILMGTAIGAIIEPRNKVLTIGSFVAVGFGIATLIWPSWLMLSIGTVIFLAVQSLQRDPVATRA